MKEIKFEELSLHDLIILEEVISKKHIKALNAEIKRSNDIFKANHYHYEPDVGPSNSALIKSYEKKLQKIKERISQYVTAV